MTAGMAVRRGLIAAVMGGAMLTVGPAMAQDKLDAGGIERLLIDRTFNGTISGGAPVMVHLYGDGSAITDFRLQRRTGEWRISGDAYCARWFDLDPTTWGCFNVLTDGDTVTLQRMNGTVFAVGEISDDPPDRQPPR